MGGVGYLITESHFGLKWEGVGYALAPDQSGEDLLRISSIGTKGKVSYEYFWCLGLVGFGRKNQENISFLSHGKDNTEPRIMAHYRDAIRRLLDTSDPETCDFVIFGGEHNIPGANLTQGTLHASLETQSRLVQLVCEETQGLVNPIVIPPSELDNGDTDLCGKSILVETPTRNIHLFESLVHQHDGRFAQYTEPEYQPPHKRAHRY